MTIPLGNLRLETVRVWRDGKGEEIHPRNEVKIKSMVVSWEPPIVYYEFDVDGVIYVLLDVPKQLLGPDVRVITKLDLCLEG